jgi:hypothetical protein
MSEIEALDLSSAVVRSNQHQSSSKSHIYWPSGVLRKRHQDFFEYIDAGFRRQPTVLDYALETVTKLGGLGVHDVILFGAGELGQSVFNILSTYAVNVVEVYDKNVRSFTSNGITIHVYPISSRLVESTLPVVIASQRYADEMREQLRSIGVREDRIL